MPPRLRSSYLTWTLSASGFAIAILLTLTSASVHAEPMPGDVYREYIWRPEGKWQRITYPEAEAPGAQEFLPNAVNTIELTDLKLARKVEMQLELLQSHSGTIDQAVRVNAGEWILIEQPDPSVIPGRWGATLEGMHTTSDRWLTMRYPSVPIPIEALHQGENNFEFTVKPGHGLGEWWPQSIVYGVVFRVFYENEKPHPTGAIRVPLQGDTVGVNDRGHLVIRVPLEVTLDQPNRVHRLDYFGRYKDFDWDGDGVFTEWQYHTIYGEVRHHIGTSFAPDFSTSWDPRWIPDQDGPIQISSKITGESGICYMTPAVTGLHLKTRDEIRLYRPYEVPAGWQTRNGKRHTARITLPEELDRIQEARIFLATWNGWQADEIGINDTLLCRNIGSNHNLSYDFLTVPVSALKPGENEVFTFAATEHHGIEVLWPGMVLLVRYAPEQ